MDNLSNSLEFLANTIKENKQERFTRLTQLADTMYQAKILLKEGKNNEAEEFIEMAIDNCQKILLIG